MRAVPWAMIEPLSSRRSGACGRRVRRQGDEFTVAGYARKALCTPVVLGLCDALGARRDKVPLDVPWLGKRLPTNQHQPRSAGRAQHEFGVGLENHEFSGFEAAGLANDLERA